MGASNEPTPCQCCIRTRSWVKDTSISAASSSSVGLRPCCCISWSCTRFALESMRDLPKGRRIVRAWSATALWTVVRIHQVAYVEKRRPRSGRKRPTALSRPREPSWTRSSIESAPPATALGARYGRTIETTSRMLAATIRSRAQFERRMRFLSSLKSRPTSLAHSSEVGRRPRRSSSSSCTASYSSPAMIIRASCCSCCAVSRRVAEIDLKYHEISCPPPRLEPEVIPPARDLILGGAATAISMARPPRLAAAAGVI
mmetsp:Transcript_49862/g.99192  ORF Transcript_49862/g.99192 Transcript_49862/m.99192 type:complete len:258 (-) Transcript_49862:202-975(-)